MILADRGFNIHDSAELYCAQVKVPPYTRGKKQLSKAEVDVARDLSRVRIHVERVIGLVSSEIFYFGINTTCEIHYVYQK